jgi:HSP20 family protein
MFGSFESGLLDEFRRLEREMDQLFGAAPWPAGIRAVARGSFPPVNIGSTPDRVDIYLFAAGLESKSLDISIQQNLLIVAGERKPVVEESANYYRNERFEGEFRRVVTLPEDVDPDKVEAAYRDGVLHVAVERRGSAKPRQIEVR